MKLDLAAAQAALDVIGARIGLPEGEDRPARAAEAALRVTTAVMVAEMAKGIAQRGLDMRNFTLLPFGGAGPTQANLIAEEAGLTRMIVPGRPGIFCALGAIMADVKRDYVRTRHLDLTNDREEAARIAATCVAEMAADARDWISREGDLLTGHDIAVTCDMRYHGQAFDLNIPVQWDGSEIDIDAAIEEFHRAHERLYHF